MSGGKRWTPFLIVEGGVSGSGVVGGGENGCSCMVEAVSRSKSAIFRILGCIGAVSGAGDEGAMEGLVVSRGLGLTSLVLLSG